MLRVFHLEKGKDQQQNPLAKIQPKPSFFNRLPLFSLSFTIIQEMLRSKETGNAVPLLSLSVSLPQTDPSTNSPSFTHAQVPQPRRSSSSKLLDIMLLCIS
jgi:hypothetical protein